MSIASILHSIEAELTSNCAIPDVAEIEHNKYSYTDPTDLHPYFLNDGQNIEEAPVTAFTIRNLIPLRSVICLGPLNSVIDEALLNRKKEEILLKASSSIGDGCFKIAKEKFGMQIDETADPQLINDTLKKLIFDDPSDSMLICNPLTLNRLSRGILANRLQLFKSGKIQLNSRVDSFHPVFTPPNTPKNQLIICNIRRSFVYSSPKFEIAKHNLIFNFKMDIQSTNDTKGFTLPVE